MPLLLLFVLLQFFCFSCYQPKERLQPVLTEEQLVAILKDIHLAEAMLTTENDRIKKDSLAYLYYEQIFFMHKVDTADFNQSMNALFSDPERIDSLYKKVMAGLGAQHTVKPKPKTDKKKKAK